MRNIDLTILMPCLNESKTLASCINKAKSWSEKNHINYEILIVDNKSTDNSATIANKLGVRVIVCQAKGYGNALQMGLKQSRGKYVIMGDCDESYDFSNLNVFLDQLVAGHQMVIGNRFKGGIEKGAMSSLHYIGNKILSKTAKMLYPVPISDFHCGLRGVEKSYVEQLDLKSTGMEFASEMIIKAHKCKLKICEVPTALSKDGRGRNSHLNTWKDGWRHLKLLIYLINK